MADTDEPSSLAQRVRELGPVLQFMRTLWAVVHALQRTSKQMEQRTGVTGPQRLVLRAVGLFPDLSPGELARLLHVHPSTLTGVLARLVQRGLLERTRFEDDRRRAVLRLTAAGARINRLREGTVEAAVAEALEGLPAGERTASERVLTRLAETLGQPFAAPRRRAPRPRATSA